MVTPPTSPRISVRAFSAPQSPTEPTTASLPRVAGPATPNAAPQAPPRAPDATPFSLARLAKAVSNPRNYATVATTIGQTLAAGSETFAFKTAAVVYALSVSLGGVSLVTAACGLAFWACAMGVGQQLVRHGLESFALKSSADKDPAAQHAVSLVALPLPLHAYVASIANRAQVDTVLQSSASPRLNALFFGPPGTGKTEAIRWVTRQVNAELIEVDGDAIVSKWVGESERNLAAMFKRAEESSRNGNKVVVVYIDEIDGMLGAGRHLNDGSNNDFTGRFLSSLLQHMDRCAASTDSTVIVTGSTNTPDRLDPAVRRRFHRKIEFPMPDKAARTAFFDDRLQRATLEEPLTTAEALAADTDGMCFAELDQVMQEAAESAVAAQRLTISRADFRGAISGLRKGKEAKSALHEAGSSSSASHHFSPLAATLRLSAEKQRLALLQKQYRLKLRMAALDAPHGGCSIRRRADSHFR